MPVIVAGKLFLKPKCRDEFIDLSIEPISLARANQECEDFSVSPDPIDCNRVNVFEKWVSREALDSFRSSGPDDDYFSLVESFDVAEYEIQKGNT